MNTAPRHRRGSRILGSHPVIAVIGAGVAGLTCARTLVAGGHSIIVFDKYYRPEERVATQRVQELIFNLRAQDFHR